MKRKLVVPVAFIPEGRYSLLTIVFPEIGGGQWPKIL